MFNTHSDHATFSSCNLFSRTFTIFSELKLHLYTKQSINVYLNSTNMKSAHLFSLQETNSSRICSLREYFLDVFPCRVMKKTSGKHCTSICIKSKIFYDSNSCLDFINTTIFCCFYFKLISLKAIYLKLTYQALKALLT